MSVVTNVILTCFPGDTGANEVFAWLYANKHGYIQQVDDQAGGHKAMECEVYLIATNMLDRDAFLFMFNASRWEYPECAQLMMKHEQEDVFTTYIAADFEELK
ncbi:hypothetical protein D3C85_274570 [compost metagenome]